MFYCWDLLIHALIHLVLIGIPVSPCTLTTQCNAKICGLMGCMLVFFGSPLDSRLVSMRVHKAEDDECSFSYGDMLGSRTRIAILSQALTKITTSSAHRLRDFAKRKTYEMYTRLSADDSLVKQSIRVSLCGHSSENTVYLDRQ
jgi:hypothetical protein